MFSPHGQASPQHEDNSATSARRDEPPIVAATAGAQLPPGVHTHGVSASSSTARSPARPGFAAKSSAAVPPGPSRPAPLTLDIPRRRSPPPPPSPSLGKHASVPTPGSQEFTAAVAATQYGQSLVGSDHHQAGSLKRYAFNWDGSSKGQTDVEEFLDKLNIIATGLRLSDEATLCLLTLSVTDGAYATVSSLLGRSTESASSRLSTVKA